MHQHFCLLELFPKGNGEGLLFHALIAGFQRYLGGPCRVLEQVDFWCDAAKLKVLKDIKASVPSNGSENEHHVTSVQRSPTGKMDQ